MEEIIERAEAKRAKLTRYFTGRPCVHGHTTKRLTNNGACLGCVLPKNIGRVQAWKAKQDPDVLRAAAAKRAVAWRRANPEKAKEKDKRDRARGAEKIKQRMASWRARNKEHVANYETAYNEAHPEEFRLKCQRRANRRRGRVKNAEGSYTKQDIDNLMMAQSGLCSGCQCDITIKFEIDHKVPVSRGGSAFPFNLQLLCRSCNAQKAARTMEEWQAIPKYHHGAQIRASA